STKHGETLLAATVAVDAKDAAETAAENAATFDPDSYYPKGETYNQTELDDALEAKVDSSDLVPYFQNMEVFTSSGTFTPPAGVDRVYALIVNGGRGGNNGTAYIFGRAGTGGSSVAGFVDVSSPVTVTIGAGGGAQTNGGISEFDGKSTSLPPSNALTLSGQNGGGYNADGYPGGASGHGTGQYGRGGIGG
ncbi:hypothetical protein O4H47_17825, partial [Maritalea porphyrae]|nr:hypothetical protein [Maritalea porphyrae]